jgi:diguanylate cyclase (GGDEF)-like protein
MKILVLESDPKERGVIQQVVERDGHTFAPIETSEQAWPMIQTGEVHFLIGNWDTSDMRPLQFISRVRAMKLAGPLYILAISGKSQDEEFAPSGADDILPISFTAHELSHRIIIGERIIELASKLSSAHAQLGNMALFDNVTGLMNRPAFYRQSAGELERARRASVPLSLIALDIDNFKAINAAHGNEVGDDVLRIVAQTIRDKCRPYDCIGRWAGDEFVIILAGIIGADAEKIAERIIAGVNGIRIEVQNDAIVKAQISAGIASASRVSASAEVEELIQQARQSVMRAKEAGGNRVYLTYV